MAAFAGAQRLHLVRDHALEEARPIDAGEDQLSVVREIAGNQHRAKLGARASLVNQVDFS